MAASWKIGAVGTLGDLSARLHHERVRLLARLELPMPPPAALVTEVDLPANASPCAVVQERRLIVAIVGCSSVAQFRPPHYGVAKLFVNSNALDPLRERG